MFFSLLIDLVKLVVFLAQLLLLLAQLSIVVCSSNILELKVYRKYMHCILYIHIVYLTAHRTSTMFKYNLSLLNFIFLNIFQN